MNRRTFVGTVAASLAATGLVGCATSGNSAAVPSTQAPDGRLKKAVVLGMVQGQMPLVEKFKLLKAAGFDGVEVERPGELDPKEILRARDESGLAIHSIMNTVHWKHTLGDPDPAVREQGLAGLRSAIEDAHLFGATTVLLVPAVVNKNISYDEAYRRSQEEIRKVIPFAAKNGVRIGIENVWNMFLLSPLEMARYIDEFKSPWVGAYFDAGNIYNYGWPEQWIRVLGPRILKVHVKGYSRSLRDKQGPGAGFNAQIGEDEIDWTSVRKALADVGYRGWITAEVGGGGAERMREIATRLDENLLKTV